jgi:hypothetical protein
MRANVLNSGSIWLALKAKRKEEKATRIWNGNEGVFHGVTSDVTATTAHFSVLSTTGGRRARIGKFAMILDWKSTLWNGNEGVFHGGDCLSGGLSRTNQPQTGTLHDPAEGSGSV